MSSFESKPAPSPAHLDPFFPYTWETNPYRCKRAWPPQFDELNQKHQFSLERRYRRRMKLKFARPGWTKGTKLAQWGLILAVGTYGVVSLNIHKPFVHAVTG